jgi:hypothetical protein
MDLAGGERGDRADVDDDEAGACGYAMIQPFAIFTALMIITSAVVAWPALKSYPEPSPGQVV